MSGTLSHTPGQILRQLLIDLGLASDGGEWPAYAEQEPDSPDDCITIYSTGEASQGRFQVGGEEQSAYSLQVKVRSANYQDGHVKVNTIKVGLSESVHNTTVTVTDDESTGTATQSYLVYSISRRSGPFTLRETGTDRKVWTLYVQATIIQSP